MTDTFQLCLTCAISALYVRLFSCDFTRGKEQKEKAVRLINAEVKGALFLWQVARY